MVQSNMVQIDVTDRWHDTFPGGRVGVLLLANVDNTGRTTPLEARKRETERRLRERFAGFSRADLLELDILKAYRDFYRGFGNTYHVQLQLESVVHKGRSLPSVSPLVDANFAAELETLVLTAGHDAERLEWPLTLGAAQGGEVFTGMNGSRKTLKPNDMMMSDAQGVVCTIICGQDARTPISPATRHALYVAYAPPGVPPGAVEQQLNAVYENVRLFAPEAVRELLTVYVADES